MLGPFATASRSTPPVLHCHSPGVATVARRLRIDVHNNDDDNNDNAWQRGPVWPHRMGPKTHIVDTVENRRIGPIPPEIGGISAFVGGELTRISPRLLLAT